MKRKVLFFLPFAEGVLNKELSYKTRSAGGAELQSTFIADLIKDDSDTYFISIYTKQSEKNQTLNINGIRFIKIISLYNYNKIIKLYEFVLKPLYYFIKINPDFIYIRANSVFYLPVLLYTKISKAKLLLHISTDMEVEPGYKFRRLRSLIVKTADKIICQTQYQCNKIALKYKSKSSVLPNIFPVKSEKNSNSDSILWVGNISRVKQPELFLELVTRYPEQKFIMVGLKQIGFEEKFSQITKKASELPNLKFYDFINFYDCIDIFKSAAVLINTSLKEGFPNTFLQAMATDTLILSLNVDPDSILSNGHLGYCFDGNFESMAVFIKEVMEKDCFKKDFFSHAETYLAKVNSPDILNKYKTLFT